MSYSYNTTTRYVPHSETTKTQYEQLLLDLRRCLPPGVDEDLEDIAEEVLSIVCVGATTGESVQHQQEKLERLLDTPLKREARDQFLRYGKLITDYVVGGDGAAANSVSAAGNNNNINASMDADGGIRPHGIMDLDEADGPSSSSSSDAGEEDLALLTGMGRRKTDKKKRKALKEDKNLSHFAFSGPAGADDDNGMHGDIGDGAAEGDEGPDGWGADDAAGQFETPKISFEEVACNAQFVKDALRRLFPSQGVDTCEAQTARVVEYLAERSVDEFTLETQLTAYLGGYDDEAVMDWIADVRGSRWCIVYGLRYAACTSQKEKNAVMDVMRDHAVEDPRVEHLYQSLTGKEVNAFRRRREDSTANEEEGETTDNNNNASSRPQPPLRRVDLQACAFRDERTPHRYVRATVPAGTHRAAYETHDEVVLPHSASVEHTDPLVRISEFPAWCHDAFKGVESLNPMQSKVYASAFGSDENMLVSAPTGAGKTNVAMMTMLRAIHNTMSGADGSINLRDLKMVYVAPMKALVQEVVRTFSARLEPLGLTVAELSGDSSMTQQQMLDTQLIVTTPEKWDIVTRKSVELGVASLLKLLIIDEVHLLHNERGPVLEAIVARTMIQQQLRGSGGIRIVGLSATLPNYEDVASFLQVDRQRGLFVFDSTFRPIPLEQTYCAVKKIRGMNQAAVMNRVVYDKVLQTARDNEQVMIFVHSRKETEYTAMYLKQRAQEEHHGHHFVRPGSEHERVLQETVNGTEYQLRYALQQLIPGGFGIHHAGLSRDERQAVETLFADRRIKVLVCTSTLAWGVNLPANRVIIKGTRVFNGAKGETELLSALDVLQMFGRAGRVGFGASVGRAAIITSADDLHYYLCVLNEQLPIESQMMKRVVDMLNAEITLGHVESTKEAVQWLQRTYLYVRMRKVPEVYGIRPSAQDPLLLQHLENIAHTACEELKGSKMADYDVASRRIGPTSYGRIASHCYVTATSMATYLNQLSNSMQDADLFRTFAMSSEFANLSVRAEEQAQMKELLENAPIAVKESRYTPLAKINILLQCYISRKSLEGLPLMSEIVYIKDSAQRILRALYEICLVREYGRTARQFLQLYAMVLHRQWSVESPVRQVQEVLSAKNFDAILPTLERVRVSWEELRRWSPDDLAEKLTDDRRASMAHELIQHVPHYVLEASVRPLTRGMLYVDVDITPDFLYNEAVHGRSVCEVLLTIEHTNGRILHHEVLQLPLAYVQEREVFACAPAVVPMVEPKPTHLLVRCTSLSWLGAESTAAVCLLNVALPAIAAPLMEMHQRPSNEEANLMDVSAVLEPYHLAAVADKIFPFTDFFASQRDLVSPIMDHEHDNIFVGMPPGAGKTTVAELFVLQFLISDAAAASASSANGTDASSSAKKLIYVTSHEDTAERRYMDWSFKFGETLQKPVVKLDHTRNPADQLADVEKASIIIATGTSLITWVRTASPVLQSVTHIIADHLHLLRAPEGRFTEECLARLQSAPYLVHGGAQRARLLALSYPLISCEELCKWLRIPAMRQYNLGTSYRQLQVRMESLELPSARGRYEASIVAALKQLRRRPYNAVPAVIFVPYARDAEEVAKRALLRCREHIPEAPVDVSDFDDKRYGILLAAGIAFVHRGTSTLDLLSIMDRLHTPAVDAQTQESLPLIVVCAFDAAWRLSAGAFGTALVCCAERYSAMAEMMSTADGMQAPSGPMDCTASELLQMTSRASHESVVFCRASRVWAWSRMLNEPLPLESHLRYPHDFCDTVNAAVAQHRATTRMDVLRVLQSHYFLYHLRSNGHFYGVTSPEDIPLFASDFSFRIVQYLQEQGCVEVLPPPAGHDAGNEEVEEDDPHARLRPTVRGSALAHHCMTVESTVRLSEAMTEARRNGRLRSAAALWRLVASESEELTPTYLGDAARITEAAEGRALHTIARALPAKFEVNYIDLDFSKGYTKMYLLILAHCARLFSNNNSNGTAASGQHVFQEAEAATPSDVQLLCSIPPAVAARLADDVQVLLPTVCRVVAALAELLDSNLFGVPVTQLMQLSQCMQRRVWMDEDAVMQLPTVQQYHWREIMQRCGLSLETLQRADASSTAAAVAAALEKHITPSFFVASSVTPQSVATALCAEATAIPRVTNVSARGGVEEVNGLLAIVITVQANVQSQPQTEPTSDGGVCQSQNFWLRCECKPKGASTGKLLAMRVTSLPVHQQQLEGRLLFPLSQLEQEGDLNEVVLTTSVISVAYRVSAEASVVFDAPQ